MPQHPTSTPTPKKRPGDRGKSRFLLLERKGMTNPELKKRKTGPFKAVTVRQNPEQRPRTVRGTFLFRQRNRGSGG
jgi:hypothetical protein